MILKTTVAVFLFATTVSCTGPGMPPPLPDRSDAIIRGVNYVGISVSDLDKATDFYTKPADLKSVHDTVIKDSAVLDKLAAREGVAVQSRLLKSVNAQLRLMKFEHPSELAASTPVEEIQGSGFSHVCFQALKETNLYQHFLQAGGAPLGILGMVQLNPRNPVDYAYLRDPDGTIFEVEHVDVAALDLETPPKNDYRLRHVAIATPDVDRAANFYSVLLEEPDPRRVGGSGGFGGKKVDQLSGLSDAKIRMAWFQIRNVEFEIGQYLSHTPETPDVARPLDALGYNMVVFDVTSLDAAKEKLIEAGGTVVSEVEILDGGEIFFGRDPDLNLLGFQVLPAESAYSAKNFKDNGA